MFHPAFAHFFNSVERNQALPDVIIHQAVEYMKAVSVIYDSEETHQKELAMLLYAILNVNIQVILNKDNTNLDGIMEAVKVMSLSFYFKKIKTNLEVALGTC